MYSFSNTLVSVFTKNESPSEDPNPNLLGKVVYENEKQEG